MATKDAKKDKAEADKEVGQSEESQAPPMVTSFDFTADIIDPPIGTESQDDEFPLGFVWFAPNIRWFGSYHVAEEQTVTGRSYDIQRWGTKVDIRDMEALKELRVSVFCRNQNNYLEVAPLGVTSV